jgi:phospholipase C
LPLLLISTYAKVNFVDHQLTDQTSIIRIIEENWNLGHIGNHSFDQKAGSLTNMFDLTGNRSMAEKLFISFKWNDSIKLADVIHSKKI